MTAELIQAEEAGANVVEDVKNEAATGTYEADQEGTSGFVIDKTVATAGSSGPVSNKIKDISKPVGLIPN